MESNGIKKEWQTDVILSKIYDVYQIPLIDENTIPHLTEEQQNFRYDEESDVLNVALFGMTEEEWKEKNPKLAKNGNIRDYTDLLHLLILNNLETTNAELIENNVPQHERIVKLNDSARIQMKKLKK